MNDHIYDHSASEGLNTNIRSHRGYAMPTVTDMPSNLGGLQGISAARENHQSNMKDRLSRIMDDTIGRELPLPEGYKPTFKDDHNDPKKYDGSPKLVDLEEWLLATTNRFTLQWLGDDRPEIDKIRVMMLLDCLDGTAYKWMLRHVTHVNREIEHWTFKDVIHGLYDHFVHPSSMQDARENLNKVEYSLKEGIQGLYNNMLEHTGGMAMFPDDYSILSIFLDKIPTTMMSELLNRRGLTPEFNALLEFVVNAIDIEQRGRNETYYRDRREKQTTYRAARDLKAQSTPRNQGNATPRPTGRIPERNTRFNNTGGYGRNRNHPHCQKTTEKAKLQDKMSGPHHASYKHGKEKQPWTKKPFKLKDKDSNDKNCYNRGSPEHWSRNCPEPRRNKTFVRATRSVRSSGSEKSMEDKSNDESDSSKEGLPTISEVENEDHWGTDDHIEVEVLEGNDYYEEDDGDDRMFGM
jgi:hypothetical protein